MTSFATRSVRLMAAVATGACALVGAHQMRATLLTAVVAVGAFAWVLAVVWLWLGGARGTRLGAGAATVAVRCVLTLLALVGALGMLGGLDVAWGGAAVALWWVLSARRVTVPRGVHGSSEVPGASAEAGARRDDASARNGPWAGPAADVAGRQAADEVLLSFAGTPFARIWTTTRAGGGAAEVAAVLHGFNAAAVRSAWAECRSLGAAGAPSQAADLATIRGALLDEFERRDPAAFSTWLAAGGTDDPPLRLPGTS